MANHLMQAQKMSQIVGKTIWDVLFLYVSGSTIQSPDKCIGKDCQVFNCLGLHC